MSRRLLDLATAAVLLGLAVAPATAQTTGQIVGTVRTAADSGPLPEARVTLRRGSQPTGHATTTDRRGRFVLIGIPPGSYTVQVRHIGYRAVTLEDVRVRANESTRLTITLPRAGAVRLAPVVIESGQRPLLQPEVTATRQVVSRDELQRSPIEDIQQALELRTGVSDGHFRGGRLGQETYIIDGVDVKNQFSASTNGVAFQLAPSAVQEVSVLTSGFSADQGTAVSGVVNLVTRSGPRDHWIGRLAYTGDEWAPSGIKRGYDRVGATAGGPLAGGATIFLDLEAIGQADQDPRVHGLTCLAVSFPCPATSAIIPHHQGDRYYLFGKLDVPLGQHFASVVSVSRNRDQHELYSTRFKYALPGYLGERETATLGTFSLRGTFQPSGARAVSVIARVSLGRVDRYLGVPDTAQPAMIGRFRIGNLRFRGEDFTKSNVAQQIASGRSIPGYVEPSDSGLGSPYGIFGSDLFVTDGTSGVAQWTRSDFADFRLDLQTLVSPQHDLKVGGDLKLYRIATYQDVAGALAGAAPNYVKFYPRVAAAWIHNTLHALDAATIDLGVRLEAFQPRLTSPTNRRVLTAPTETTAWKTLLQPRIGFAMPLGILGLNRASVRWNFGLFSQPPDFQFFFDQSLDDSLNTAVRRQGNPNLGFERAIQYEAGFDYIVANNTVLRLTGYYKNLTGLTTSGIAVAGQSDLFTNLDFGRVDGFEARLVYRPMRDNGARMEIGYAFQKAVGVVSTAFDSTGTGSQNRIEVPLQFDQRHSIDVNAWWPLPAGFDLAVAGSGGSGLPVPGAANRRLPWTADLSMRLGREWALGAHRLRLTLEARNLLGLDNLVTARPGGGVMPDVATLEAEARAETAGRPSIPRESPWYLPAFDANHDGYLDSQEQYQARRAALLDYNEPTLFYGEARQVRLGAQILF